MNAVAVTSPHPTHFLAGWPRTLPGLTPPRVTPRPLARGWAAWLGAEQMQVLSRLARGFAASRDEAEELVQDGLMRALNAGVEFESAAGLTAWMHTVMYRMAIDRTRRARRRRWDSATLDTLAAPETERTSEESVAPWTGLDLGDVRAAAASLPETLRHTFCLFAFERRSYEEIALLVGVPVRTVGTRLCRARKKLRDILQSNRTVTFPTRPANHDECDVREGSA
ncbi:MAG TPA: sigma-70 family RNA polymerase sigma factor [Polyangia bacterium]